MARLASIEKAGYFPCPTNVVETLVRATSASSLGVAPTYILDPCAGEGRPSTPSPRPWPACPPPPCGPLRRHAAAVPAPDPRQGRGDRRRARSGSQGALGGAERPARGHRERVGRGQVRHRVAQPALRPAAGGRAELAWVRMCAPFVGESGMLVLIVPDMFVGTGRYAKEMAHALYQAGFGSSLVLRFPDPEYEPFKQVAILASRPVSSGQLRLPEHRSARGRRHRPVRSHPHPHHPRLRNHALPDARHPGRAEAQRLRGRTVPRPSLDLLGDPSGNARAPCGRWRPCARSTRRWWRRPGCSTARWWAARSSKAARSSGCSRPPGSRRPTAGTEVTEVIEAEVLAAQLATIDMRTGRHRGGQQPGPQGAVRDAVGGARGRVRGPGQAPLPACVHAGAIMGRYEEALGRVHAPRAIGGPAEWHVSAAGIPRGRDPRWLAPAQGGDDGWRDGRWQNDCAPWPPAQSRPCSANPTTRRSWCCCRPRKTW